MAWQGIVAVYPEAGGARRALGGLEAAARQRGWSARATALRRAPGGALRLEPAGWLGRRRPSAPMRSVGERLTPGASALVAVVEPDLAREVERWLAQDGANLVTDMLLAEVAELESRGGARPR